MSSPRAVQFIYVPHRPVHSDEEIKKDLAPAFSILFRYAPYCLTCCCLAVCKIGKARRNAGLIAWDYEALPVVKSRHDES